MFGRKKEIGYAFVLDTEQVIQYFKENNYIETTYKKRKNTMGKDRAIKDMASCLSHIKWIKGYELFGLSYLVYHGENSSWAGRLFENLKETAEQSAGSTGACSQVNEDIENYVIRDIEGMTFYMLRVGADIISTCLPREREEEMKKVFTLLNTFVYKRAV